MSNSWYYLDRGQLHGPMSSLQLRLHAMEGLVGESTPVRKGAGGKWVRASQVRGLLTQPTLHSPPSLQEPPEPDEANAQDMAAIPVALEPKSESSTAQPSPTPLPPSLQDSLNRSTEPKPLLPDDPPVPRRWVVAGLVGLLAVALVGLLYPRGENPTVAQSAPAEQEGLSAADANSDSSISDATRGQASPVSVSLDESDDAVASEESEPGLSSLSNGETASEPEQRSDDPSGVPPKDAALSVPPTLEERTSLQQQPGVTPAPSHEIAPPVAASPLLEEPTGRATPPARDVVSPKSQELDEADRNIAVLKRLFEKSHQLFATVRESKESIEKAAVAADGEQRAIAQLEAQLKTAMESYQFIETEKRRVLRNNPRGVQTPALDQQLRVSLMGINRIKKELLDRGFTRKTLEAEVKGTSVQLTTMFRDIEATINEWTVASAPFGGLLNSSYLAMADQATEWIGDDPRFPLSYLTRGFARTHLADFNGAIADYESMIEEFPDLKPLADAASGFTLCVKGDLRRGAALFRQAEKAVPDDALLQIFWGFGLAAAGKSPDAVRHFRQALVLDEKSFMAHEALAMLWAESKITAVLDSQEAIAHAEAACDLVDWGEWHPISTLATTLANDGQFDEAAKMLRQVLPLTPRCRRAEVQLRLDQYRAGNLPPQP